MTFTIYPAIDVREGRVVRLRQADYGQEKRYADYPGVLAERYAAAPTLSFALRLSESTGEQIHAVALRCEGNLPSTGNRIAADGIGCTLIARGSAGAV